MRIKDLGSNHRPIVLGDFGDDIILKDMPNLSKEELLALQPASTQRLLRMTDEEHQAFHASELKFSDVKADPKLAITPILDSDGNVIGFERGGVEIDPELVTALRAHRQNVGIHLEAFFKENPHKNKTSLIDPKNKNGVISDEDWRISKWRRDLATSTLSHNTEISVRKFEEANTPKFEWTEMTTFEAIIHWIKGNKIEKIEKND